MSNNTGAQLLQAATDYIKIGSQFSDWDPKFVFPNYGNPNYVAAYIGNPIRAVTIFLGVLMTVTIVIRVLARGYWRISKWGWDDTWIIVAFILTWVINGCTLFELDYGGLGKHTWDLVGKEGHIAYMITFIHIVVYIFSSFFTKMSLAHFYLRLLMHDQTFMKTFVRGVLVAHAIFSLAMLLYIFNSSTPRRAAWDLDARLDPNYSAPHKYQVLLFSGWLYVVLDLLLWIQPMIIISRLQMSIRRRIGINLLFAAGGLCCIAAALRAAYLWGVYDSFDGTWNAYTPTICDAIECNLAIVIASLPAVNSMVRYFRRQAQENGWFRSLKSTGEQRPSAIVNEKSDSKILTRVVDLSPRGYTDLERGISWSSVSSQTPPSPQDPPPPDNRVSGLRNLWFSFQSTRQLSHDDSMFIGPVKPGQELKSIS